MDNINVIRKIEALACRLEKGRQLVADDKVKPVIGNTEHFIVESSTGNGYYLVNGACTCRDYIDREELTKGLCKHRLAVLVYVERREKETQQPAEEKPKTKAKSKAGISTEADATGLYPAA